jgi:hypothetical protein
MGRWIIGDDLRSLEGKGRPKNDRRHERFEALIQSQNTIATLDPEPAFDEARHQVATHSTEANECTKEHGTSHKWCGTSCRHTRSKEATQGFRRAKQRPSIIQSPATIDGLIETIFEDITGDDGSAVGNHKQEKELS